MHLMICYQSPTTDNTYLEKLAVSNIYRSLQSCCTWRRLRIVQHTMTATTWTKFRLLLWKNAVLMRRKPVALLSQIGMPVLFTVVLLSFNRDTTVEHVSTDTMYPPVVIGTLQNLR